MTAAQYPPQPAPDVDTEGFWEATAEGRLALCRCTECRRWLQPPLERCRHCAGTTAFEDVAGTGTIHSFIVQRQPSVIGYADEIPYVVALVELDDGPRIISNVLAPPDAVEVGMAVEAAFVPAGEDAALLRFRPIAERSNR
jgi:uncharacterized protein